MTDGLPLAAAPLSYASGSTASGTALRRRLAVCAVTMAALRAADQGLWGWKFQNVSTPGASWFGWFLSNYYRLIPYLTVPALIGLAVAGLLWLCHARGSRLFLMAACWAVLCGAVLGNAVATAVGIGKAMNWVSPPAWNSSPWGVTGLLVEFVMWSAADAALPLAILLATRKTGGADSVPTHRGVDLAGRLLIAVFALTHFADYAASFFLASVSHRAKVAVSGLEYWDDLFHRGIYLADGWWSLLLGMAASGAILSPALGRRFLVLTSVGFLTLLAAQCLEDSTIVTANYLGLITLRFQGLRHDWFQLVLWLLSFSGYVTITGSPAIVFLAATFRAPIHDSAGDTVRP